MFHGGRPPGGRYPRPYAPRCRTPFDQPQGPNMATDFGPQIGPVSYNLSPRPRIPCRPQYERLALPQFYHGNSEELRRSSTDRSYPSPGPGNNQGPCGGPPGDNMIGRQLNPSLPCSGFSGDQTHVSTGNNPLGLPAQRECSQYPDSRKVNPLSLEDLENERAGEEFLRCLAAKDKYPLRQGDPHYRPPCPGNGQGQELGADDQACKRHLGRSKSRPRSRSRSRGKSMGRSKSRPHSRSRSRGKSMGRSKSRPHSRSRSRSRGKSMGRSKSRPRSRSRGKSMGRSKSRPHSRSRSRGKSVGRSKSRPRSPSRAKSIGRSKSRPRSRSRSREKSPGKSCTQGAGRAPSQSCSGSSSSSIISIITQDGTSRTAPPSKKTAMDVFRELLLAGQLKEREELLTSSKMAAQKKQLDSAGHGQASTQTHHSPVNILGEHQSSSLPRETQSLLCAMTKWMDPSLLPCVQGQAREQPHGQRVQAVREDLKTGQYAAIFGSVKQETEEENVGEFLLPHERVGHDNSGFSRILGVMGNLPDLQEKKKIFTDIEDEEKFLYGDEDDKGKVPAKTVEGEQAVVDFDKIKKALTTIGLDLGKAEISKMMARTQEHQTCHTTEGPPHKGPASSGGLSPSQSLGQKRNRSPNEDVYSNSHSSAKQALYSGAPASLVGSEFDTNTQEKQTGGIPFFRPDIVHQPLMTTDMQSSALGSETPIWGQTPLKMANYWPQKSNLPLPHAPAIDLQILGLGPLKQALESVKATTKASGMDTVVDLANQNARMRTSQRQNHSEENAKGPKVIGRLASRLLLNSQVKEEALKTDIHEQIKRKDYLLKELESLLKRDVSEFVVPVIGFCCQLCEEFFGDVTSARDHATCPSHKEKCQKHVKAHNKSGGNLQVRPTERRDPRESEHRWTSKEESKDYRATGEKFSVKEEKADVTRPMKVATSSSATPSKTAGRKETDSARSSVTGHEGKESSKAHKKKKKKKEKKRLKKEKKKEKKGKD